MTANGPAVDAFVKSEAECLSILHKNRDQAIDSIRKHSGSDDPELAAYSYDFFEPLWAKVPTVDPALMQQAFAEAAADTNAAAPTDVSKYIDNAPLQTLQSNGFIDSLYKS